MSNLYTRQELVLALIKQKYWILAARNLIRQTVHKCNLCLKFKPLSTQPPMGHLPAIRVFQVKSFVYTAVDYGGPFYITHIGRRGIKIQKAYTCLFVCLATNKIHSELVSDLSTYFSPLLTFYFTQRSGLNLV